MNSIFLFIVLALGAAITLLATIFQGISAALDFFTHPATAGRKRRWIFILGTCLFAIIFGCAAFLTSPFSPINTSVSSPTPTVNATVSVAQLPSPVSSASATATSIPSLTATAAPTKTPCPTAAASTTNVDAVVTVKGCPPVSYPVNWVFGFVSGNGIGMTASSFMSYGSGQSLGAISQLGIAPTAPYSGPPLASWLFWNSGGYAMVISNTAAQPTADQLGTAALHGGFVNWGGGGAYLPQTYELTSTTPQPGGAQGYQFNLVVKT